MGTKNHRGEHNLTVLSFSGINSENQLISEVNSGHFNLKNYLKYHFQDLIQLIRIKP